MSRWCVATPALASVQTVRPRGPAHPMDGSAVVRPHRVGNDTPMWDGTHGPFLGRFDATFPG